MFTSAVCLAILIFVLANLVHPALSAGGIYDNGFTKVIDVLAIPLFGFGLAINMRRVFDRSPALIINGQGILNSAQGWSFLPQPSRGTSTIPWSEVSSVEVSQPVTKRFFALPFQSNKTIILRGLNNRIVSAINTDFVKYDPSQLVRDLNQRIAIFHNAVPVQPSLAIQG